MNEYEFAAELSATGFSLEIELIAEFDYTPGCKGSRDEYGQLNEPDVEEDIEITNIKAGDKADPFARVVASMISKQEDFSQLEDEILNNRGN